MNSIPDHQLEDTREPDTRGDAEFEKLVDSFDAGKLDAEFVAWAATHELKRTGDAIAKTRNDKAARAIYQSFAAHRHPWAFDAWLECSMDMHTDAIATILREEEADNGRAEADVSRVVGAASNLRDDDYGWRPVKEFKAYQWERECAERRER